MLLPGSVKSERNFFTAASADHDKNGTRKKIYRAAPQPKGVTMQLPEVMLCKLSGRPREY